MGKKGSPVASVFPLPGGGGPPLRSVPGPAILPPGEMPAPRQYASRGVPRRATTRRSGDAGSSAGFAALLALLVIIATGVVRLADPFSASNQIVARSLLSSTSEHGDGGAGGSASGAPMLPKAAGPL